MFARCMSWAGCLSGAGYLSASALERSSVASGKKNPILSSNLLFTVEWAPGDNDAAYSILYFLSVHSRAGRRRVRLRRDALQRKKINCSKAFALTWYRALTWYCSPARPFAAPDVPQLVTGQQGGPSLACRQLSRPIC